MHHPNIIKNYDFHFSSSAMKKTTIKNRSKSCSYKPKINELVLFIIFCSDIPVMVIIIKEICSLFFSNKFKITNYLKCCSYS